jgi:diacylglycerol kinase family enzyme
MTYADLTIKNLSREIAQELEFEEKITFNVDGEKITAKKFIVDILPNAITIYNDNKFVEKIMKI